MKISAFLFIIFSSVLSHAQSSSSFKVQALYEADGFLTERFIPFAVHRSDGTQVDKVISVNVPKPCYSMVDPHRSSIFHIYCEEASEAVFSVNISDKGQSYQVALPAISVAKLALVSSTPKPDPDKDDPLAKGRKLFTNNCARCHPGSYPLPSTVTSNQITSAINSVSAMSAFKSLTSSEINELVKYINEGL